MMGHRQLRVEQIAMGDNVKASQQANQAMLENFYTNLKKSVDLQKSSLGIQQEALKKYVNASKHLIDNLSKYENSLQQQATVTYGKNAAERINAADDAASKLIEIQSKIAKHIDTVETLKTTKAKGYQKAVRGQVDEIKKLSKVLEEVGSGEALQLGKLVGDSGEMNLLPKDVLDSFAEISKHLDDYTGQFNDVENSIVNIREQLSEVLNTETLNVSKTQDLNEQLREQLLRRTEIMTNINEENARAAELHELEETKIKSFLTLQDAVYDKFVKEREELEHHHALNERIHHQQVAYLDSIKETSDEEEHQNKVLEERTRYRRVREGIVGREAVLEKQEGVTGGLLSGVMGSTSTGALSNILRTSFEALGIGTLAFGMRDLVAGMKDSTEELRRIRTDLGKNLAVLTSTQGAGMWEARAEVYGVGRRFEALGIKEETTFGAASTLAGAGIALEDIPKKLEEVITVGIAKGIDPEKMAQIYDTLFRELRVPTTQLGNTFLYMKKTAEETNLPFEEFFKTVVSVQSATKQYGYTVSDTVKLVSDFGQELRDGTITLQMLTATREDITKLGVGPLAFMGEQTKVLEALGPENRRAFDEMVGRLGEGKGDPFAIAEVLKGILSGQAVTSLLTGEELISATEYGSDMMQQVRTGMLDVVKTLALTSAEGISGQNEMFRLLAKNLLRVDLTNMTLDEQANYWKAYQKDDKDAMKKIIELSKKDDKRSATLVKVMQDGLTTAKQNVSLMQGAKTGISNLYRKASDQLRFFFSTVGATPEKELQELKRGLYTNAQLVKVFEQFGGKERLESIGEGQQLKITKEEIIASFAKLGPHIDDKIKSVFYEAMKGRGMFVESLEDVDYSEIRTASQVAMLQQIPVLKELISKQEKEKVPEPSAILRFLSTGAAAAGIPQLDAEEAKKTADALERKKLITAYYKKTSEYVDPFIETFRGYKPEEQLSELTRLFAEDKTAKIWELLGEDILKREPGKRSLSFTTGDFKIYLESRKGKEDIIEVQDVEELINTGTEKAAEKLIKIYHEQKKKALTKSGG